MNSSKLKIRHLCQNQILIWIIILTPFLILPSTIFLGIPSVVKYVADLSWALLLLTMLTKRKRVSIYRIRSIRLWVILFFVLSLLLYIINFQSIFYYLWGIRNNIRFYILFFAVIFYFRQEDIDAFLTFTDIFFVCEILALCVQFFVFHYQGDDLGGIFGNASGCNSFLNLFFCIYLTISYMHYLNAKINLTSFMIKAVLMLVFSGFAEIKFFYIEFIVVMAMATLISRFSFKKLFIIIGAILIFIVGYRALAYAFPNSAFTFDTLLSIGTDSSGYTASGDLNRLHFIGTVNTRFLNNPLKLLFGLGMGNCDYAEGYALITTPFYNHYGWMHYTWLSTAHMYLENGLLGLVFLFGFFVMNIVLCCKYSSEFKNSSYAASINKISIICSVIAMMNLIYNNSLRTEAGYMIYLVIAFPYVMMLRKKEGAAK